MLERNALSVAYRILEDDVNPVLEALEAFPPESIVTVDLSGNKFTPAVCTALKQRLFPYLPNLTELDAKDNKFGAAGWAEIREALQRYCPSLTSLDLSETMLRDDGVYEVALMLASSIKLRDLGLVTNHITSRGVPSLCDGLRYARFLNELMLDYNMVSDDGAVELCQAIADHPALTRLGLSDNGIGDRGAGAIATYILGNKGSRIEWLNLSVNRMGDQGFVLMCRALTSPSGSRAIRHIDFGCNPIQTVGRQALCSLAGQMNNLLSLDLCSMELADSDVELLLRALQRPTCRVTSIEWFNNPMISQLMETRLHEALACNFAAAERAEEARRARKRALLIAAGAAFAALSVVVCAKVRRAVGSADGDETLSSLSGLEIVKKILRPAVDLVSSIVKVFGR